MNSYNLVMRTGYAANSDESHDDLVRFVNVYCGQFNRSLQIVVENPDTIVIVSGGKGYNEPCTEAQGMFDYLVRRGIPAERILQEDKSTNTHQNLKFSSSLMESKSCSVGIVTNNFHIFRSIGLARKQGFTNVCGISAPSNSFFQPNNMLREFFGVMKDWMAGNS